MIAYALRRMLAMIPTLLAISVVTFIIIQLPPGDYLSNQIAELKSQGDQSSLARIEFLRRQYGFDKPMIEQYAIWAGLWPGANGFSGLLQGDLGWSFEHNMPVNEVIGDRVWLTVAISFATVLFTWALAFPIGVYSATHQYSAGDYALSVIGFLGLATPNFLLALVLLYAANALFGVSIGGLMEPHYLDKPWSWGKALSVLEHLWAPVIVIGTSGTAALIRRLRANLLDELGKAYVTAARARGVSGLKLLAGYPLRVALNPFIADIGNMLPGIVSGAAIVSVVLSLPTTGPMLLSALKSQDQYLAGSFLMALALMTVVGTLISDLLLAAIDPRIRLKGGRER